MPIKNKLCTKCKLILPVENFGRRKEVKSGHRSSCKECVKKDRREYYSEYYRDNRDKRLDYVKEYRGTEKGKIFHREVLKKYKLNNRHVANTYNAKRRVLKLNGQRLAPSNFDKAYIEHIYIQASNLTKLTGIKHNVDHIVPMCSPLVCGLHVPWNLEILEASINQSKSNKLTV